MNVDELYHLTLWVDENVVVQQILQKYTALYTVLNQNTQANKPKQPFESHVKDLTSSLQSLPLFTLTKQQESLIDQFGALEYLGLEGVNYIEQTLQKNALDIATATQKIQTARTSIDQFVKKSNAIKASLADIASEDEVFDEKFVNMSITFSGGASLENIADLKNWGASWYDIARGFSMAVDGTPEDIRITGASKGSIILYVATSLIIAKYIGKAMKFSLEVADQVLDLKLKAEDLKRKNLENKKIADLLLKESENQQEKGIERIVHEFCNELKLDQKKDGEKINALILSIEKLTYFMTKGGGIDLIAPPLEREEDKNEKGEVLIDDEAVVRNKEIRELSNTFEEVRRIENHIKQIEDHFEEDAEE